MKLLAFNLTGKTAFFKTNAFNEENMYFSYGQIHKVALLGILGAKIGLDGHSKAYLQEGATYIHPEFYTKLKDLGVAIVPKSPKFIFPKKNYTFINNCGYNKEANAAQTLVYTEQWLHDVSWDIYLDTSKIDKTIAEKLEDYIINNKSVYPIYLGKTNHFASIKNVRVVEAKKLPKDNEVVISSIFKQDFIKEIVADIFSDYKIFLDVRESLPSKYCDDRCSYESSIYCITNKDVILNTDDSYDLVSVDDINICLM